MSKIKCFKGKHKFKRVDNDLICMGCGLKIKKSKYEKKG